MPDALAGERHKLLLGISLRVGRPFDRLRSEGARAGQIERSTLAPDNVRGYYVKAVYLPAPRRPDEALGVADAGPRHQSELLALYLARAIAEIGLGRPEPAKTDMQLAMRLSPRDPFAGMFHGVMEMSEFGPWPFRRGHRPSAPGNRLGLSGLVDLRTIGRRLRPDGKMDEAKAALAEARGLNPKLTVRWMIEHGR